MLAVTPKPDLSLPAQASPLKVMITRALDRILFPPLLAKWKDLIAECVTPKKIPMFKQELAEQLQQYRQEILRYLDRKNDFLKALFESCIKSNQKIYYCDTNTQFAPRTFNNYAKQMFHVKIRGIPHLRSILTPMGQSDQFRDAIVIIDSLSHLIQGGDRDTFVEFQHILEDVVSGIFTPIQSAAARKNVTFIIIHHFAFNPKLDRSLPVAYDLMQNLPGMWAMLNFEVCTEKFDLTLEF
jgi:hypothetical protein